MKIVRLFDATGGSAIFVVGDNTLARGNGSPLIPKGFVMTIAGGYDMAAEQVQLIDADSASSYEWKNETSTVEVSAEYGFDSESERDLFCLSLQSAVPRLAHVEITVAGTTRWIPAATTRPIRWSPVGEVACVVTYTFTGGRVTTDSNRPENVT